MEREEMPNLHSAQWGTTTWHDKQQTTNPNTVPFIKRIFRPTRLDFQSAKSIYSNISKQWLWPATVYSYLSSVWIQQVCQYLYE